jgi:hypothetical protein
VRFTGGWEFDVLKRRGGRLERVSQQLDWVLVERLGLKGADVKGLGGGLRDKRLWRECGIGMGMDVGFRSDEVVCVLLLTSISPSSLGM